MRDAFVRVLLEEIARLTTQHPMLTAAYLGSSILNRGIPLLKLGNGKRKVLYVGAHHGMEWITSALLMRFVEEVCMGRGGGRGPGELDMLLHTHTLLIVPMLNPDGVDYQIHGTGEDNPLYARVLAMNGGSEDFSHWQANARGVDLNHNYDAGFSEYRQLEEANGICGGAPTRYSGEVAESEPEVAALCNLIRYHHDLRGVLTLHTQGEEIYWSSGGICPRGGMAIARRLSALSGYRLSVAEGMAAYGGLTDWCIRELNLPAFTLECGRGVNPLPYRECLPIYVTIRRLLWQFPLLL